MSLCPDHVEAACPGVWSSLFARVANLFDADLVRKQADWAFQYRETGVMVEQDGPAMEPSEGHMENVG